jgi:hypothetical protein
MRLVGTREQAAKNRPSLDPLGDRVGDQMAGAEWAEPASGNWTGYWGKQGPELLDHRLALYSEEQRMVFGANTYRAFARMLASSAEESEVRDHGSPG